VLDLNSWFRAIIGDSNYYVRENFKMTLEVTRGRNSGICLYPEKEIFKSVSLAKICYAMERHVRAVKPAVNGLISKGLLEDRYEGTGVRAS